MRETAREVEVSEAGLTLLLLAAALLVSGTFYLGVCVGRAGAPPAEPVTAVAGSSPPGALPSPAAATATPPVAATPAAPSGMPGTPLPSPAGPGSRRPALPAGFIGPPPLPSPTPAGGQPGASLQGVRGAFAVEVLSVADSDVATREYVHLLGRGYPAYLWPSPDDRGVPVYRVRVGDYVSEAQAVSVQAELSRAAGRETRLVR